MVQIKDKAWVQIRDVLTWEQIRDKACVQIRDLLMGVQIKGGDEYRSEDIGKYGYRSGISWVQIGETVQIRDLVQARVLHI